MNETHEPRGKEGTVWEGETDIRRGRQTMMLVCMRREWADEDQMSVSS